MIQKKLVPQWCTSCTFPKISDKRTRRKGWEAFCSWWPKVWSLLKETL